MEIQVHIPASYNKLTKTTWNAEPRDISHVVLGLCSIPPSSLTGISFAKSRLYKTPPSGDNTPATLPPTPSSHTHIILLIDTPTYARRAADTIPSHHIPVYLEPEVTGLVRGIPAEWIRGDVKEMERRLMPWTHTAPSLIITRTSTLGQGGSIDDTECYFAVLAREWETLKTSSAATLTHIHTFTWHRLTSTPLCHLCWLPGHTTSAYTRDVPTRNSNTAHDIMQHVIYVLHGITPPPIALAISIR